MINLTLKQQVGIFATATAVAFASGRYSAPVTPDVQTDVTEATKQQEDVDKDTHQTTVTVIEKAPDGKEVTTIKQNIDTVTHEDTKTNTDVKESQTVTAPKRNTLN